MSYQRSSHRKILNHYLTIATSLTESLCRYGRYRRKKYNFPSLSHWVTPSSHQEYSESLSDNRHNHYPLHVPIISIVILQSSQLKSTWTFSIYPDHCWETPLTGHFPWWGQIHFVTVPTQKRGFTPFIFNDSLALMPRERDNTHAFLVTIWILFWSFNCWSTLHTLGCQKHTQSI